MGTSSYKRVKGRSHGVEERASTPSYLSHATSQPHASRSHVQLLHRLAAVVRSCLVFYQLDGQPATFFRFAEGQMLGANVA